MRYSISYNCYESIEPKLSTVPKIINILFSMGISPVYINQGNEMNEAEFQTEMQALLMLYIKNIGNTQVLTVPGMKDTEITVQNLGDRIKFDIA